jgi:hypothetical protein
MSRFGDPFRFLVPALALTAGVLSADPASAKLQEPPTLAAPKMSWQPVKGSAATPSTPARSSSQQEASDASVSAARPATPSEVALHSRVASFNCEKAEDEQGYRDCLVELALSADVTSSEDVSIDIECEVSVAFAHSDEGSFSSTASGTEHRRITASGGGGSTHLTVTVAGPAGEPFYKAKLAGGKCRVAH